MTTSRRDTQERLDARKVLQKISGKRPGKPCGKSYIAADRKCGSHYSNGKLNETGKKAAELLAAKVRARKGLADKTDIEFARRSRKELLAGINNPEMRKRIKASQDKVKAEVNTPARKALIKQATENEKGETRKMTVAERRAALRRKYGAPDDGSRMGKLARQEERRAIVGLGAEAEQPLGKRKRELVEKTMQRLEPKLNEGEKKEPTLKTVKIGGKQYDIPKGEAVKAGVDFNTLSSSANRLYVAFGSNGDPIRETRDPQTGRMQVVRFREQSQAENFAAKINKALNRPEKKPEPTRLTAIDGGKKKDDRTLEQLVTEAQKIGAKYDDGTADLAAHREAKKLVGETVGKAFEKGKGRSAGDRIRESADKLKAENEVQKKATVRILTASAKIAANQDKLIDEAVDMANQDLGVKGGKTKREKSIAQMTLEASERKQPEPKQPTAKGLSTRIRASADTLQAETEKQIKATSRILGATAQIASNQDKLIEEMSSLAESDLDAKTRRAKISRAKNDRPSTPALTSKRQSVADINAELRKKNGIIARKRSVDSADERIAVS